jgi:hypothetical protein
LKIHTESSERLARPGCTRSGVAIVLLNAIVLCSTSVAYSQSSNEVAAEALFREGRKLVDAGRYREGCEKLAASQRLDPAPGTLLNLATCLEKNGQTASAWATYSEAMGAARAAGQKQREQSARTRAEALEPSLPRLVISVPADVRSANVQIKRDGVIVPPDLWGIIVPVDPGVHLVEATATGKKPWSTRISSEPRALSTIDVPPLESASVAGKPSSSSTKAAAAQQAPSDKAPGVDPGVGGETHASNWNGGKTAAVVLAGVGAAGLAVGAVEWFLFQSKKDDAMAACPTSACYEPAYSYAMTARSEADTARTLSIAATAIGGASLVAAVVVWVSSDSAAKSTGAVRLIPLVGTRSAGFELGGAW